MLKRVNKNKQQREFFKHEKKGQQMTNTTGSCEKLVFVLVLPDLTTREKINDIS